MRLWYETDPHSTDTVYFRWDGMTFPDAMLDPGDKSAGYKVFPPRGQRTHVYAKRGSFTARILDPSGSEAASVTVGKVRK